MTVYILAGGNDRDYPSYQKKLASLTKNWVIRPKILSCFFAKDIASWQESAESWEVWFKGAYGQDIEYTVASIEKFEEEVAWADIVYFHGGDTLQLVSLLKPFDNIEAMCAGKIVIGSSAGTNFLSKVYYSPKRDVVEAGSGIIDLATVVHYGAKDDGEVSLTNEQWQHVIERTQQASPDKEILLLPEGDFVSIVK